MKISFFITILFIMLLTQLSLNANDFPVITNIANGHQHVWDRQYGSISSSLGRSVATDSSGNIYITGQTGGALDGNTHSGGYDIFLSKYSADGTKQWTRQYGSSSDDYAYSVATDSSGNIYITGQTGGALDSNTNSGGYDIFLSKYSVDGTKQWTKQYGSSGHDYAYSVATDSSGNIYITGRTEGALDSNTHSGGYDIFLSRFSSDGTKQWTKQYGSSGHDYGRSVATDSSGNIYITGQTGWAIDGNTNNGGDDIFLSKYSVDGTKQWSKQYGSNSNDRGFSVATDNSGNIYITGQTGGALDGNTHSGGEDIFLSRFSSDGAKQWTKEYGTSSRDLGRSVATDNSGNIYIIGYTEGALDGNTNSGLYDIFLSRFSSDGTKQWTKEYGSSSDDYAYSVATDSSGHIYIAGSSGSALSSHNDIFLSRFERTISMDHIQGSEQVIVINAIDVDGDVLTYTIGSGVDSNQFNIDSFSGVLSFNTAPYLNNPTDSDANNIYEVAVSVSDNNAGVDTISLFISIVPLDSTITPKEFLFGTASGETVFTVTNPDTSSVTLPAAALEGPQATLFSIVADGCNGTTLAQNEHCIIRVGYPASTDTSLSAYLKVNNTTAFLHNYESTGEEAARRLSPVIDDLNIDEMMNTDTTYHLTWSIVGYGDDYTAHVAFFDCSGTAAGTCGENYGSTQRFDQGLNLRPTLVEPAGWTYHGEEARRYHYAFDFTPQAADFNSGDTPIVIRFYYADSKDIAAGLGSISLIIPGNLSENYYDTSGRKIQKIIHKP